MNNITSYIYLLQEREFIKTNENIYKIGKSKQENLKRFKQYPKGSRLLLQIICFDCDVLETRLIKEFKKKFIHRSDIGAEYFEGNYTRMIEIIYSRAAVQQTTQQTIQQNKEILISTYESWIKHSTIKTIIPDKTGLVEGLIIFNSGTSRKFHDPLAPNYNTDMETLQDFIKANQQKNIKYDTISIYNDITSNLFTS